MTASLGIACLLGSLDVDDATIHALDLLPALVARGHAVTVFGMPGSLSGRFEDRGVTVRTMPGTGDFQFGRRRDHFREIGANDVIHVLDLSQARRGGRLALLLGRPWVLSVTSVLPSATLDAIHRPAAVLVSCRSARDEFLMARPAAQDRVHVVPPEIDIQRFSGNARPLKGEVPVVGALTCFDGPSGVPDLLNAVRVLLDRKRKLHAVITGFGPRGQTYRRLARRLNVAGCVTVASLVRDFETMLAAMDVFVSPRRRDWFGGPIVQAMGAGRPVIAAGVGAAFSLIREPLNGRLVPGGDPIALADAVELLLDDPEEAQRLGGNARKIVAAEYRTDLAAARTERIYRKVLKLEGANDDE